MLIGPLPPPRLPPFHEPLGTPNIQHPTSNTQPPINGPIGNHWLFDIGCWVLDVFLRFMGSMRKFFGEFSPRSCVVGRGRKHAPKTSSQLANDLDYCSAEKTFDLLALH